MRPAGRRRRPVDRPTWLASGSAWPRRAFFPGDPVRGYQIADYADFAIVGEGPGADEALYGYPMIGATGQEVDRHLERIGLQRYRALVTNITTTVPPKKGELGAVNQQLDAELDRAVPIVLALGRPAVRHFLGDVDLEAVHGIPVQAGSRIVLPGYHPAAGMHQVELSAHVQHDFDAFGALMRGELTPRSAVLEDEFPDPQYRELTDRDLYAISAMTTPDQWSAWTWDGGCAIDTEGSLSVPWGLSFSTKPGTAFVIRASAVQVLAAFRRALIWARDHIPGFVVWLHNSMHDLPILRALGIDLVALGIPFRDTMIVAYQLCVEPQGLKALCIRHAGMAQQDYSDLVGPYTWARAMGYLAQIAFDPDPPSARDPWIGFEIKHGDVKAALHKPTRIDKRALKILKDVAAEKRNKDGELPDPFKRWYQVEDEDRAPAEAKFGVLQEASLDEVPDADAVYYSARDADATRRIAPVLMERHRGIFGSATSRRIA